MNKHILVAKRKSDQDFIPLFMQLKNKIDLLSRRDKTELLYTDIDHMKSFVLFLSGISLLGLAFLFSWQSTPSANAEKDVLREVLMKFDGENESLWFSIDFFSDGSYFLFGRENFSSGCMQGVPINMWEEAGSYTQAGDILTLKPDWTKAHITHVHGSLFNGDTSDLPNPASFMGRRMILIHGGQALSEPSEERIFHQPDQWESFVLRNRPKP